MAEPVTAQRQIKLELSSQQETLKVGHTSVIFQATVYNDSDRFASFQVKLLAAGVSPKTTRPWYRLSPSVSSKIPAGDCTQFQIEVFDLPPITDQFRGAIDLTVEVTSRELENQYDREYLRLLVEGVQGQPPTLALLDPLQQVNPGDRAVIAAEIHNPTSAPMNVTLRLAGLPEPWFPRGIQQTLALEVGKPQKVTFACEIPVLGQAPSQKYPLTLEATGPFPTVTTTGEFFILPSGTLIFNCDPLEQTIPPLVDSGQNPPQGTAQFTLEFTNQSNIAPTLQIAVRDEQPKRRSGFWQQEQPQVESSPDPATWPVGITLKGLPTPIPLGTSHAQLEIQRRRRWLGWVRLLRFQVTAQVPDTAITVRNETQTIQVQVFPIIPLWQQLLGLFLALGLGALTWILLAESGHQGPVNSVQFSGQGREVVSGSDDQTVRTWQIQNQRLQPQRPLGRFDKAVRVVQYRPVENDQVAVGFENGEIQIINLLTGQRSRLLSDQDDRVLALVFSRDARTLYSGHGSGLVLPWDITRLTALQDPPQQAFEVGFAIQAMAFVEDSDSILAVAGRYNRLVLVDVTQTPKKGKKSGAFLPLAYPSGGSTDYISSLSAADQKPTLVAIGDTQGRISLWDMEACLEKQGRCGAIDPPWLAHGGSPIRAVALSRDGCFMASAGDDGQVKLWSLDEQGSRRSNASEGRVLAHLKTPFNAVDVIQTQDHVWVTSGGDDGHVRLFSVKLDRNRRPLNVCPILAGDRR